MENTALALTDQQLQTLEALQTRAGELFNQQVAKSTYRYYQADWAVFDQWCCGNNFLANQATPQIIALFLTAQFQTRKRPETLTRRLAGIKFWFTQQGLPSPTENNLVRAVLKGIRRDKNTAPARVRKALPVSALKEMVDNCDELTLIGLRDKALLLLGFMGAFRRSELVSIDVEDIETHEKGLLIHIKRSKTDPEGKGLIKPILKLLKDTRYCPVVALQRWIEKAQLMQGPVFRGAYKNRTLKPTRLTAVHIYHLIKRLAFQAGYEFTDFTAHSLRSGFVTAAVENKSHTSKIRTVTHHRSDTGLAPYVLYADLFDNHPSENLL